VLLPLTFGVEPPPESSSWALALGGPGFRVPVAQAQAASGPRTPRPPPARGPQLQAQADPTTARQSERGIQLEGSQAGSGWSQRGGPPGPDQDSDLVPRPFLMSFVGEYWSLPIPTVLVACHRT
jgi:hypothetical protein